MNRPAEEWVRGDSLRQLVARRTCDLRYLQLPEFRQWLLSQYRHWSGDPVFVQRTRIRDLRSAHPLLSAAERQHLSSLAADAAAPHFARLQELKSQLVNARKAVAGLSHAMQQATGVRRAQLRPKLAEFLAKQQSLRTQLGRLVRSSPERRRLLGAARQLQQLRRATGIEQAETQLADLLRSRGRRSGRSGEAFESQAAAVTRQLVMADLAAAGCHRSATPMALLRLLQNVTLGAARVELDQVVVRASADPHEPVDVLAIVEVKRNINDLAVGFKRRQENLAWFTGDTAGYDADMYRTRHFRSGHFDRPATHRDTERPWVFTQQSFRHFHRHPSDGPFLQRLYLITRDGPIWGLSSAALSRIRHRVATDQRWNLRDDQYLERLLQWCRSLADPPESPDVLGMFLDRSDLAQQIIVVGRNRPADDPATSGLPVR